MKRSIEVNHCQLSKYPKIDNNIYDQNQIDEHTTNFMQNKINIYEYRCRHQAEELGSKMGLIFGAKLLKPIKNFGIYHLHNYLSNVYPKIIYEECKIFIANSNNIYEQNSKELLESETNFNLYRYIFDISFKNNLVNFLRHNLKNFPEIINVLQQF